MKFMKLGTRPDTFFTTESIRSVSSEVSTDLQIQVQNSFYRLHKFPLLSKCLRLQRHCSELKDAAEHAIIQLPDLPGGAEAFETCAKFCYGITITLSALNIVPVWCAAEYLQMNEDAERGNLARKLDSFFESCILRRWKDTLVTLQSTRKYPPLCEELGITARCVDAVATAIVANHPNSKAAPRNWWAESISELGSDHYWRIMVTIKSAGVVSDELIVDALQIYAWRWLPDTSRDGYECNLATEDSSSESRRQRLLMDKIVSLLPTEKGSASCSFLLKLLKVANILNASSSLRMELRRRIGRQLEEASVDDLLIPPASTSNDALYDVDTVMAVLEEFLLQGHSPPTSPPRERLRCCSKSRVAKLIDGYLQKITEDKNLPVEKLIAIAEAVPDSARPDHDDLYRAVDIYLRAHPELDKNARKQLCRILDCKKLSMEACAHAARNDVLPLRVVVQVLFFEQARAALAGGRVIELPGNVKALLSTSPAAPPEDGWSISRLKCPSTKLVTLKMRLEEEDEDDDMDDDLVPRDALMRSASSRLRALCSLPRTPKRIIGKLLAVNRSVSYRH
ncbi:unnamed protein product [Musa acuminata subsp. malaccensis]|uniref:(wild Malaysian banana) hypothetical protein n=1 Tax=Musa acuminata subsp. malaccensis TaxID=214687 RepID=A0A804K897_MUSAM|nr:PREDICTED: BTB/POZ domain-containing protein At1g67900-like [Musa acuminata subsp. malaccensis]XP_009413444.1 PREDICTED: BTB/POZ domain-containing protein At1g67900-like [Musa acuminata subsp. malaccensis]XP_018685093.1 PREDICTED: BTB/POZ domain-containing protein At1g67900-like [Musa acuminata subsp. malaccensis]CAG1832070.1 unnamed protein product [Musa acuminata subsp. malaccensis]